MGFEGEKGSNENIKKRLMLHDMACQPKLMILASLQKGKL